MATRLSGVNTVLFDAVWRILRFPLFCRKYLSPPHKSYLSTPFTCFLPLKIMGRPLYSTPLVRTESEPTVDDTSPATVVYGKWTNPSDFDPDSDEFFEREDAVFEAFLDPAAVARLRGEAAANANEGNADPTTVAEMAERLDEFIVRVAREDSSSSSSSSSDAETISGRGSPMAASTDDEFGIGSGMNANVYAALREAGWTPPAPSRPVRTRMTAREMHEHLSQASLQTREGTENISTSPYQGSGFIPPPPSSPPMQMEVEDEHLPPTRPVTPPHQLIAAHHAPSPSIYELPSPAPVTPRLYSWSSRTPFGRSAMTPWPTSYRAHQSPLTNPGARMSFAQISSTPVRVTMN